MSTGFADLPVLDLDRITRTYPGPKPTVALQPTTLRVWKGEYLTITGASGSGKSTLLNIIGLLDRPSDGTYRLDGVDVSSMGEAERAAMRGRRLGFVFQAFHLLPHRTAFENVILAQIYNETSRRQRHTSAVATLSRVGLRHLTGALPGTMSGGERQRVAIARAVVNQPKLLLCDEPTGNLDSTSTAAILDLLDELNQQGLTLIVITHDAAVAGRGTRSMQMHDGGLR